MKDLKNNVKNKSAMNEGLLFVALGAALMIYSLVSYYTTTRVEWKMSPYLFPLLISVFIIILGIARTLQSRKTEAEITEAKPLQIESAEEEAVVEQAAPESGKLQWKTLLISIAAILVYIVMMPYLGFLISTAIFLAGMIWFLGERKWWMILLLSVISTGVLYVIFAVFLNVMLP